MGRGGKKIPSENKEQRLGRKIWNEKRKDQEQMEGGRGMMEG